MDDVARALNEIQIPLKQNTAEASELKDLFLMDGITIETIPYEREGLGFGEIHGFDLNCPSTFKDKYGNVLTLAVTNTNNHIGEDQEKLRE